MLHRKLPFASRGVACRTLVDGDVLCLRAGGQWAAPWSFSSLTAGAGIVTVLEFGRSWG